jgi:muconate cycloisomerase
VKITAIETIPVSVPRVSRVNIYASYKINFPHADFVVVLIRTDEGVVGLGEAPLEYTWTGEDFRISKHCIDAHLTPALIGENPLQIRNLLRKMDERIAGNPYSKAAIEMALWDILGKVSNQPLYNLLGGKVRDRVTLKFVASQEDLDATVKLAAEAVQKGFRTIKLKVGFDVERDVAKVAAVRRAVGDGVRIAVDANAAWNVPDAISAIRQMEKYDLLFIEQPVKQQNPKWMAEVRRRTNTLIAAHESLFTLQDAVWAIQYDFADIWAITPSTHGGLCQSCKIMTLAEAHGASCLIGSTIELGISTAALIHLAVATPILDGDRYPSDIIGPLYHEDDIIEKPIAIQEGFAYVPDDGPGLGVRLDERKVARYRSD